MVDPGTENNHFKNMELISQLHEIIGPIHVNRENTFLITQTVESRQSGIKMRLRRCKHIVGQMRRVIYIMNHDLEIHEQ